MSRLNPLQGLANENGPAGETGGRPFIVIFDDPEGQNFDLMDLRNGRMDLLADAELAAGRYTQMRIICTSGWITLTDGRVFPLSVPSGPQTGIKLNFQFDVVAGVTTDLLLDVDMSRAFTPIPGGQVNDASSIQQFHFSPAIAMRLITLSGSGHIAGTVLDGADAPIAAAAVTAYDAEGEVTSTATDPDGTYMLAALPAGTHSVVFSAAGFQDATVIGVVVSPGEITHDVDAVLEPDQGE